MFIKNLKHLALGAGLLLLAFRANAQVIYTNVNDGNKSINVGIGSYDIDINKDGIVDFVIAGSRMEFSDIRVPGGHYDETKIYIKMPDTSAITVARNVNNAIAFSADNTIDGTSDWDTFVSFKLFRHVQYAAVDPSKPSFSEGNFDNSKGKYL